MKQPYLKCQIRPGMFSNERIVRIPKCDGDYRECFVPETEVRTISGQDVVRVNSVVRRKGFTTIGIHNDGHLKIYSVPDNAIHQCA